MWITAFAIAIAISMGCVVMAIVIESRETREDASTFVG